VRAQQAAGAINITASHNPALDNGFKVRDEHGGAIAPEGLLEIEAGIPPLEKVKRLPIEEAVAQGRVAYFDPDPAYLSRWRGMIDVQPIKDAGLAIVVDCMWGNGQAGFRASWAGARRDRGGPRERNPLFRA